MWEAVQVRMLAIALRRQGYSMAVSHEYLGRTLHNDRTSIRANFEVVFLRKPDQLKGLGQGWRQIERHRSTRNLFAHGLGTADPRELRGHQRGIFAIRLRHVATETIINKRGIC